MNTWFPRLFLGLGLAWGAPAAAGIDCDSPGNWAQRTVCQNAALRGAHASLEELAAEARLRSPDRDAFDARQRQWAAGRRDACTTVRCLQTSYRSRMDELRLQVAGGRPPLLAPGTYHRHGGGDGEGSGIALRIEAAGSDRYRLRILPGRDDVEAVEGEFTARVGSARFTAPGCAFGLAFAPDVVALSGAAGELCGEALEGSYLLGAD